MSEERRDLVSELKLPEWGAARQSDPITQLFDDARMLRTAVSLTENHVDHEIKGCRTLKLVSAPL